MSNISSSAEQARESARRSDGTFGEQQHDDAGQLGLGADGAVTDQMFDQVVAEIPDQVELVATAYDDQFTEDQIEHMLAGRHSEAENDVYESFYDQREDSIDEECRDACTSAGVDFDDLDDDQQQQLRETVGDRDRSNPYEDLFRTTPEQLVRVPLTTGLGGDRDTYAPNNDVPYDQDPVTFARRRKIRDILANHGIDTTNPDVRDAVDYLVENGPEYWHEGVRLDVLTYTPVDDVSPDPQPGSETSLAWSDPHVVLLDSVNGSGAETVIPGGLSVTLPKQHDSYWGGGVVDDTMAPRLDSPAGRRRGYGWDDTAGVVRSGYETETRKTVRRDPQQQRAAARWLPFVVEDSVISRGLADDASDNDRSLATTKAVETFPRLDDPVQERLHAEQLVGGLAPHADDDQVTEAASLLQAAAARRHRTQQQSSTEPMVWHTPAGTTWTDNDLMAEHERVEGFTPDTFDDAWEWAARRAVTNIQTGPRHA